MTGKDLFSLHESYAHTSLAGDKGDISGLCQFGWYEWCYFREQQELYLFSREGLGNNLGPATGEGNEMSQWLLKANENVVPHRTVYLLRESSGL